MMGDLEEDLRAGLLYAHDRANANTAELEQAIATLDALVELLRARGLLDEADLEAARTAARERVRQRFLERGMAVIRQDFAVGKHDFPDGVEIDCDARVHLCRAACCRLAIGLSGEDVREGILRWDPGAPYALARGDDGWCVHMERGSCRCTVYEHRPIPCRGFDCRSDPRIWIDFEGRVPNPAVADPRWPLVPGAPVAE